jgi:hypothetical protein
LIDRETQETHMSEQASARPRAVAMSALAAPVPS